VTQLTVVLHGSLISYHNFVRPCLFFNVDICSSPVQSGSVTVLVSNLYAEAIDTVKLRAALSALSGTERAWYVGAGWWRGVHLMRAALYRARFKKNGLAKKVFGDRLWRKGITEKSCSFLL
jgi:hypothetical protein